MYPETHQANNEKTARLNGNKVQLQLPRFAKKDCRRGCLTLLKKLRLLFLPETQKNFSLPEKILNKGTGYITDLGLTGAVDSILGMKKDGVMKKFVTKMPERFSVATGQCKIEGAVFEVDNDSKKTNNVFRISVKD